MKPHYAGSIAFDNERDEWQDALVMAFEYKDFIKDMKSLMERKKHSEVFFAAWVDKDGKEHDMTQQVRESCG
tara:strand:- start:344 stop:559 length:216 start_codon:yes stop_codon:yes gene_type:complete